MNQKQALEFFNGVELKFESYYKFSFIYTGEKEGILIKVHFGGCSDSIYRAYFLPTKIFMEEEPFVYMDTFEKDGVTKYVFSDY